MNVKKAREYSGYQEKPVLPVCMNCQSFTSEITLASWMQEKNASSRNPVYTIESHGTEKNLRCTAHGFAIKKLASCNSFKARKEGGAS